MKTIGMTALAALAAVALVSFASHGESNEKTGSLTQRLQGSWTMVSNVLDQDGKKSEPFGPSAKGGVIFTSNGRVMLIITRADVPKFASKNRTTGTPEENKAAVAGSIGYFGTYTANDADKTLVMRVEGSTFPGRNRAEADHRTVGRRAQVHQSESVHGPRHRHGNVEARQ